MSLSEIDPDAQPLVRAFLTPISPRRPPFTVQASKVWAPNGNDCPLIVFEIIWKA